MGLRLDLVELIQAGLEKCEKTQRELAELAGYGSESYISRLANAKTDFKIGVAARVLIPLGIRPKLVDQAEWDRLRSMEETVGAIFGSGGEEVQSVTTTATTTYKVVKGGDRLTLHKNPGSEYGRQSSTEGWGSGSISILRTEGTRTRIQA